MFLIILCTVLMLLGFDRAEKLQIVEQMPDGNEYRYIRRQNARWLVAVLVIASTLRYGFIDTYAYKEMYRLARDNYDYIFTGAGWGIETGWLFVNYCLNFLSKSPKLVLFLSALIINAAYMKMCRGYSENPVFSFFLYFCLIYMDTNNGLRQMVAAAITMFAFPLLEKKKLWSYLLYIFFVLVAYQMHNSAIICVIIAFCIIGKPLNIKTIMALCFCAVFLLFPDSTSQFIQRLFRDNQYAFYLDYRGGMRFARALVTGIVPLFFAVIYRIHCHNNDVETERGENSLLNLTVINSMFVLMGTFMQYWNRFAFYTQFAPIMLMPKLVRVAVGDEQYRKTWRPMMVALYFLYFAYNVFANSGLPGSSSDSLLKFYIEWWC